MKQSVRRADHPATAAAHMGERQEFVYPLLPSPIHTLVQLTAAGKSKLSLGLKRKGERERDVVGCLRKGKGYAGFELRLTQVFL